MYYYIYNNITQVCTILTRYINLCITAYSCSYCHFCFYCSRYKMQVFKMKLFTTQREVRFIALGSRFINEMTIAYLRLS